ncbi:unnamed protein product [Zymoseptoria tritici ST99CH_3D1]|nr:unnamed protein product [Zymoseptoria tritici ST99CH_3D1]
MNNAWEYQQLRFSSDAEGDESIVPEALAEKGDGRFRSRLGSGWGFPLALLVQSLIIVFLLLYIVLLGSEDAVCAEQLSPYSPYFESGTLDHLVYTEQNHLMQPSPYRGQPTPEVEEAWIRLWRLPMIQFPESKLPALNKSDATQYMHASQDYGGGVLGFFHVFHELHCLNMIRQYTYRQTYDYSNVTAFRAPEEIVRGHVDHCIETLRKQLMCTSDVTPVLFVKDDSRPSGMKSDFNVKRKCRDFGKIQDWALENLAQPPERHQADQVESLVELVHI